VRYLDPDYKIRESCERFEERLERAGLVRRATLGRGRIANFTSAQAVFDEGIQMLSEDLYCFLQEPPAFVPGRIPMDGATGPFVPDAQRFGPEA
jgi:hypothetical protein